jgi:hypothetical protein
MNLRVEIQQALEQDQLAQMDLVKDSVAMTKGERETVRLLSSGLSHENPRVCMPKF